MQMVDFNIVKLFKDYDVINRFSHDFPDKESRAAQIFEDLMIFFWGTKKHKELQQVTPSEDLNFHFIMDAKMKEIDEMWHVFLLFTKPYMDFCHKYFGEYIHHTPNIAPNLPQSEAYYQANLERFLSFTYDHLGVDVVERWFKDALTE